MTRRPLHRAALGCLLALTLATAAPTAAIAAEGCEAVMPLIDAAADEYGLDSALMAAIVALESRFKSVVNKRSGARGLMQIMPSTGRSLKCGNLSNAKANLACGATLLRRLLDRYDGSLMLALSGYHAGLAVPNKARDSGVVPTNMSYYERVLATRTRLLREGCP